MSDGTTICCVSFFLTQITLFFAGLVIAKKVQVGNDQENVQSERNSHSRKKTKKKTKKQQTIKLSIRHLHLENI